MTPEIIAHHIKKLVINKQIAKKKSVISIKIKKNLLSLKELIIIILGIKKMRLANCNKNIMTF